MIGSSGQQQLLELRSQFVATRQVGLHDHPGLLLLLGIAMPVFISYAQRLIPRGPRIASSLTMGASWGVASILVAGLIRLYQNNNMLDQVFWIFAAACVACSIVCLALPAIEESLTDDLSQPDDPGRDSP